MSAPARPHSARAAARADRAPPTDHTETWLWENAMSTSRSDLLTDVNHLKDHYLTITGTSFRTLTNVLLAQMSFLIAYFCISPCLASLFYADLGYKKNISYHSLCICRKRRLRDESPKGVETTLTYLIFSGLILNIVC